jgi:hypothetical protein
MIRRTKRLAWLGLTIDGVFQEQAGSTLGRCTPHMLGSLGRKKKGTELVSAAHGRRGAVVEFR